MRHLFSYTLAGPDSYLVHYGPLMVAEVFWIEERRHPANTMARIIDGLNTPTGPDPDRSTWSIRHTSTDLTRADLCHNGRLQGEFVWKATPRDQTGAERSIVAGLNRSEEETGTPIPDPAPPARHRQIVRRGAA